MFSSFYLCPTFQSWGHNNALVRAYHIRWENILRDGLCLPQKRCSPRVYYVLYAHWTDYSNNVYCLLCRLSMSGVEKISVWCVLTPKHKKEFLIQF